MGYFDRVFGRKDKDAKDQKDANEASTSSLTEVLHDTAPTSSTPNFTAPIVSAPAPSLEMPSMAGPPNLSGANIGGINLPGMGAAPSGRLYDPYDGIGQALGGKKHAFRLPEQPEFVFEEEASVRRRGWTENLQFYTGIGYLSGTKQLPSSTIQAGGITRSVAQPSPFACRCCYGCCWWNIQLPDCEDRYPPGQYQAESKQAAEQRRCAACHILLLCNASLPTSHHHPYDSQTIINHVTHSR